MQKVDIPTFRKEIVSLIHSNINSVTSFEYKDDFSIFTFCGKEYACEVTLNDNWIGIDLGVETPENNMICEYEAYNDGPSSDEIDLKIYKDMKELVQAIFDKRVSYVSTTDYSYLVLEKTNQTYDVIYNQKNKRFWTTYTSGWWKDGIEKSEYDELEIKSLKILS